MLREVIALKAISHLSPDLIIMDEFHKFKDLLYDTFDEEEGDNQPSPQRKSVISTKKNSLVNSLLTQREYPVLLLSATPYRVLNHDLEEDTAYDSFYNMVEMLGEGDRKGLERKFRDFKVAFDGLDAVQGIAHVSGVVAAKENVETILKKYIARTERYVYETEESVQTCEMSLEYLEDHISEYFNIEVARRKTIEEGKLKLLSPSIEFWKSGQNLINFCDRYAWMQENQKKLWSKFTKEKFDSVRNPKLKHLYDQLEGADSSKCLWVLPSSVMKDESGLAAFSKHPRKYLVFSAWRFVPQVIASVLSNKLQVKTGKTKRLNQQLAYYFLPYEIHQELTKEPDWTIEACSTAIASTTGDEGEEQHDVSDDSREIEVVTKALEASEGWDSCIHLPGNAVYNAVKRYVKFVPEMRDEILELVIKCSMGAMRRFFLHPFQSSVIESTTNYSDYYESLKEYVVAGRFCDVIDEYFFLLANEHEILDKLIKDEKGLKELKKVFDEIAQAMRVKAGRINIEPKHDKNSKRKSIETRISVDFNGRGEASSEGSAKRKKNLRVAFNSPFYPFVLASTSIGQEGLDFHRYCQDIVHWDLPSTPEDMEQREGRIRRYLSRSVRKALVSSINADNRKELNWQKVIRDVDNISFTWATESNGFDNENMPFDFFKNGIYPHWVFTAKDMADAKINRHVMVLPFSRDKERFRRLTDRLDLYRFALGQSDPERVMEIAEELRKEPFNFSDRSIRALSINLGPLEERAFKAVILESVVDGFFEDEDTVVSNLEALIGFSEVALNNAKTELFSLKSGADCYNATLQLLKFLRNLQKKELSCVPREIWRYLYYFASPYDGTLDYLKGKGFLDDVQFFRKVESRILRLVGKLDAA
jgi:hypothetical protein